jgi:hypothetical protein
MGRGSNLNQIQIAAFAIMNTLLGACFVSKCDISMAHTLVCFESFKNTAVC